MRYLNSYKVYEDVKNGVNIDLIKDAYDMCLHYFDDGLRLIIYISGPVEVFTNTKFNKKAYNIARFVYDHGKSVDVDELLSYKWISISAQKKELEYQIYFTGKYKFIKGKHDDEFFKDISSEVVEILKEMYPNENITMSS